MRYNFPPCKNLIAFDFAKQFEKIEEELKEVREAYMNEKTAFDAVKTGIEVMDLLHAVETLVRLCEKRLPKGITLDEVKSYVLIKNTVRGYYDDGMGKNGETFRND